jgi:hypothetical protein
MRTFVITTLAEYQTRFWLRVGRALQTSGYGIKFVSFDDRSTEMLRAAGFFVASANEAAAPDGCAARRALFASVGIEGLAFWTAHERFAFGRSDDDEMERKLARAILATREALDAASDDGEAVLVQEVGGFLSVIGAYFSARSLGVTAWFIEPSFFRGRLLFTPDSFAAPVFAREAPGEGGADFEQYLAATLASGAIVIPQKDRHHYASAWRKVLNLRNARRLLQKLVDKHVLGKRQEFGFIGEYVATHLRMLRNSSRLRGRYADLEKLGRFIYYPLHVPGDMALTMRSPEYLDQMALIDYLCRHLPDGYQLALKEHPAMIGMVDPDDLATLLDRYPRLRVIDPATNNYAVMRKAGAIVTVNSKSGAEAGLLGRPVVVLGDAFYRQAPFASPVAHLGELTRVLAEALEGPGSNVAATRQWFAAVWDASSPGELYSDNEVKAEEVAGAIARHCAPALTTS